MIAWSVEFSVIDSHLTVKRKERETNFTSIAQSKFTTKMPHCFGLSLIVAVVSLNIFGADAFHFYLPKGQQQCLGYEASRQSHEPSVPIDIFYQASNCPSCRIAAMIQGPSMIKIASEALHATGKFETITFRANIGGLHRVCLTLVEAPGDRIEMEVEIVGSNDKREHQRLTDGTVVRPAVVSKDGFVEQHTKISSRIKTSTSEVTHLVSRQGEFEVTVQSTYWRVVVFTLVNIAIVLGVGFWQVLHLRAFFKEKKLV